MTANFIAASNIRFLFLCDFAKHEPFWDIYRYLNIYIYQYCAHDFSLVAHTLARLNPLYTQRGRAPVGPQVSVKSHKQQLMFTCVWT